MSNNDLYGRDWSFIVEAIYEMNLEEDYRRAGRIALDALYVLIPSDQVMLTHMERIDRFSIRPTEVDYVGMEAKFLDKFLKTSYDNDPYFRYCNVIKETKCFLDSDVMTDEFRESTPLFKEIYAPQGIYYGLRAYLTYKGEVIGNISLFNSKEHGDFNSRDMLVLETLAPHIALRLGKERDLGLCEHSRDREVSLAEWGLTTREQEIVQMVLKGMEDHQIANSLCIAKSTVKKHIYNIYQKLDVNNRVQLYAVLTQGK